MWTGGFLEAMYPCMGTPSQRHGCNFSSTVVLEMEREKVTQREKLALRALKFNYGMHLGCTTPEFASLKIEKAQ